VSATTRALPVPNLTVLDMAFPANALEWMPAREDIPDEFRFMGTSKWNEIANSWFMHGLPANVEFYPREGVDPELAVRAIQATLGSFALKHDHKEEAAAYMLSQWFERIENWGHP
jgi:hypothetical protein